MALMSKDKELKQKILEFEEKCRLVKDIANVRCKYFQLGGRKFLEDSVQLFLSMSMIHLEAFKETWERRLHLFLKEVSEARKTYHWLNYYTMNETLILEKLLDNHSDETTILRHLQFAHPHLAESELPKYLSSWNMLKGSVLERVGGFLHRIFGDIGEEFFRKPLVEEKIGRVSECE